MKHIHYKQIRMTKSEKENKNTQYTKYINEQRLSMKSGRKHLNMTVVL